MYIEEWDGEVIEIVIILIKSIIENKGINRILNI